MSQHNTHIPERQRKQPPPGEPNERDRKSAFKALTTHYSSLTTRAHNPRAGFTLLEVILAITIAGALLAGAAALMVSITDAWLKRQDRHFFEDHVDGVSEFVQACFSMAGQEIALEGSGDSSGEGDSASGGANGVAGSVTIEVPTGNANGGGTSTAESSNEGGSLLRASEDPVSWSKPPGFADYKDPLLSFALKDTPPLLVQTGDAPIIGVNAFLYFEKDEGLALLWYTPLQEDSEDIDDLRRTPISDLVTEITYIYWDEDFEKWEEEEEPKDGEGDEEFILPRFIKLIFEYEDETKERTITIPVPSKSALLF